MFFYELEDRNKEKITTKITTTSTEKTLFIGLDLGQAQDFSALAIIECVRIVTTTKEASEETSGANTKDVLTQLNCIHLQRWQLRTSYPSIVADVVAMINGLDPSRIPDRKPVLCVDGTGCGAAVIDLFKLEKFNAELLPILITGGSEVTRDSYVTKVPKRDLVGVVQVGLQNRMLKIASGLDLAETLSRELQNFTVKITDSANDVYGAWREGAHDDILLAVALAVWRANQPVFRGIPVKRTTAHRRYW
jgi:hypothetical protein